MDIAYVTTLLLLSTGLSALCPGQYKDHPVPPGPLKFADRPEIEFIEAEPDTCEAWARLYFIAKDQWYAWRGRSFRISKGDLTLHCPTIALAYPESPDAASCLLAEEQRERWWEIYERTEAEARACLHVPPEPSR